MHRLLPRLPYVLLGSALAISAFAVAPALSEPAPAAAPNDLPDPLHPCTVLLCLPQPGKAQATAPARDAAGGLPTGKRMHKPYTAQSASSAPASAQPAACAATDVQPVKVASDPEEGGQVARTAKAKPTVSDISVTKKTDTASTKLMESTPSPLAPCPPGQH